MLTLCLGLWLSVMSMATSLQSITSSKTVVSAITAIPLSSSPLHLYHSHSHNRRCSQLRYRERAATSRRLSHCLQASFRAGRGWPGSLDRKTECSSCEERGLGSSGYNDKRCWQEIPIAKCQMSALIILEVMKLCIYSHNTSPVPMS
jgi:hypothetical protein